MNVFATDEFLKELYRLRKKRPSICTDIGAYIQACNDVETLIKKGEAARYSKMGEPYHPYKNRIALTGEKSGARGGLRLISLVEISTNSVYLLHVYPKSGAGGKTDVSSDEWKAILKSVRHCVKHGFITMEYNPELIDKQDHKESNDEMDLGLEAAAGDTETAAE